MNKKKILILYFFLTVALTSCGFKILKNDQIKNFRIAEINLSGERKINFKIKNKLKFYENTDGIKQISLDLATSKSKTVKEKNIKNEVTKYEIKLNVKMIISSIGKNEKKIVNLNNSGDYLVEKQNYTTRNSEKKLVDRLTDDLTKKILNVLSQELNDL